MTAMNIDLGKVIAFLSMLIIKSKKLRAVLWWCAENRKYLEISSLGLEIQGERSF
jgi:hypothetical protein